MQTLLEIVLTKKYLAGALVASAVIVLSANAVGEEVAVLMGNFLYIPIAGTLLGLSVVILGRFGLGGSHGLAWFAFLGYALSWFMAEMLWLVQELYLKIDPFPSASDVFYIVGYPFLLMFFVAYLQPVRAAITAKVVAPASAFSVGILALTLYHTIGPESGDIFATVLATIYPIFDSMVIIPALVGVVLFFKGKVNFMWTLFCFGTVSLFVADTAFLMDQNNNSYYTGNPMEILFYWNYILMAFGVHNHISLFRKNKSPDASSSLGV
ncbi:hypothetical protein [Candidatus Nitrosotenuis cloacae]|jgi:hypothetical protein|uniref:hypothetical protein n=1 Tax=Candidatus Nitrosotenuis cloacae TaxID=1603555 RepID=UPI002280204C|nr:hypothetical protein [Candidatus Nitrosotenuis cloacae]